MSTDFCMETLLAGGTSSSTVPIPTSPKTTILSAISQLQELAVPSAVPAADTVTMPSPHSQTPVTDSSSITNIENREAKKKGIKRKRNEEETETSTSSKKKRVRTAYTQAQLLRLESIFRQSQYPDMLTRQNIAEEMGLEEKKIHVWFQNRRAKHRKAGGSLTASIPSTMLPPAAYPSHLFPPFPSVSSSTMAAHPLHYPAAVASTMSPLVTHPIPPPVPKIPPSTGSSPLPLYLPLRSPSPAVAIPTAASSIRSSSLSPPQQSSIHSSPLELYKQQIYSSSPPPLFRHGSTATVSLPSVAAQTKTPSPTLPLRPAAVHLLRRNSPESARPESPQPLQPLQTTATVSPTLTTILKSPAHSTQFSSSTTPLPLTRHHQIENYPPTTSNIVFVPVSNTRLCSGGNVSSCVSSSYCVL